MALEDAAILSSLLSHISHPLQIPLFLKAYESLRLERATKTQESSRLNQWIFHLNDTPKQEVRDKSMRERMWGEKGWKEGMKTERESYGANGSITANGNLNGDIDASDANDTPYDADAVADLW